MQRSKFPWISSFSVVMVSWMFLIKESLCIYMFCIIKKLLGSKFFENFENFWKLSLKNAKNVDSSGKIMGYQNHLRPFFPITNTTWREKSKKAPYNISDKLQMKYSLEVKRLIYTLSMDIVRYWLTRKSSTTGLHINNSGLSIQNKSSYLGSLLFLENLIDYERINSRRWF